MENNNKPPNITINEKDDDPTAANPMLYGPLHGARISKTNQYVATVILCLSAVAAGTGLAWTSPVLTQLEIPKTNDTNSTAAVNAITIVTTIATFIDNATSIDNETSTDNVTSIINATSIDNINSIINATSPPTTDAATVLPNSDNATSSFKLTKDQGAWVAAFLAVGALIGAVPMGILAEKVGRKKSAIVIGSCFIIGWAVTVSSAGSFGVLCLARLIVGIATGGSCVVTPLFISEFAETSIRGMLGTCFQLFLTIGILLVFVVGSMTSWINLSWVCCVVPVLLVVGMLFIPESPVWLLKQNRHNEATLALKWFWGKYCDANAAIQEIQNDLDASGGSGTIRDLLVNRTNRNGFIISIMLMFFQQFSGINAVIFFTNDIFKSSGSTLNADVCSIIVGVVQVLTTFAAAALVERAGRKILLIQSSAVMFICLIVLGIYFKLKIAHDVSSFGLVPLVSLVLFIISFSLGYGPIPWMMMGELLAPEVKGVASTIVVLFNWTSVFIVTKTFPLLKDWLGDHYTFWIFAVVMFVGTIYGFKALFETKGKSNAQIQLMLSSK